MKKLMIVTMALGALAISGVAHAEDPGERNVQMIRDRMEAGETMNEIVADLLLIQGVTVSAPADAPVGAPVITPPDTGDAGLR